MAGGSHPQLTLIYNREQKLRKMRWLNAHTCISWTMSDSLKQMMTFTGRCCAQFISTTEFWDILKTYIDVKAGDEYEVEPVKHGAFCNLIGWLCILKHGVNLHKSIYWYILLHYLLIIYQNVSIVTYQFDIFACIWKDCKLTSNQKTDTWIFMWQIL